MIYIDSFELYLKELIDNGYITEDGTPLKCQFCESDELETINDYEEFSFVIEKVVYCKSCDERVGNWSYGNWQI